VQLFDDLRGTLADTLRARVLVLFGRAIDRVDVEIEHDIARGDLVANVAIDVAPAISPATTGSAGDLAAAARAVAEQLTHGMHLPQLVASASIEDDGRIKFHLDRGAVAVVLLENPPVLSPATLSCFSAEQSALVDQAAGRARSIVDTHPSILVNSATDRLLLGSPIPDGWWGVLRSLFYLPESPPEACDAFVRIAAGFRDMIGEAEEAPSPDDLPQMVAASLFRIVAANFGTTNKLC
jgi:hypothetical protein